MRASDLSAGQVGRWVTAGDLSVNMTDGAAMVRGAAVELSPTEGRLFACLATHHDMVIPARVLTETLWGADNATTRAYLQLYVRYLQHKLQDDPRRPHRIRGTVQSGYQLVSPTSPAETPLRGRRRRLPGLRPAHTAL
jgi:DNA-binding response OmpR family regulator